MLEQSVDISRALSSNAQKKSCILIPISLQFIPNGQFVNISVPVLAMVWWRTNDKPEHITIHLIGS